MLVAIGGHSMLRQDLSAIDAMWLAVRVLVSVAFGALRAATTVVYPKDGVLWQRYTWKTLVVFVVTFAISLGVGAPDKR